jgi:hypothetical protein
MDETEGRFLRHTYLHIDYIDTAAWLALQYVYTVQIVTTYISGPFDPSVDYV